MCLAAPIWDYGGLSGPHRACRDYKGQPGHTRIYMDLLLYDLYGPTRTDMDLPGPKGSIWAYWDLNGVY